VPKIPESYHFGDRENLTIDKLIEIIEDMYQQLAAQINQKPNVYARREGTTPTLGSTDDTFVENCDLNIKTDTGTVEMATRDPSTGAITWTTLIP